MRFKQKPWNEEDIAILRAMSDAGHIVRHIADKLKRTEKSVAYMKDKLGIYHGRDRVVFWTPEKIAELRVAVDAGMTLDQLAETVGTTPVAVARKVNYLGWKRALSPRKPPRKPFRKKPTDWTDEQIETLRRMAAAGRYSYEIAPKVGRSREGVAGKAKKLGIALGKPDRREGPNPRLAGGPRVRPVVSVFNDPSHLRHVARFLRERGYSVAYLGNGFLALDRRKVDAKELVAVANRNRRLMGLPEFTEDVMPDCLDVAA